MLTRNAHAGVISAEHEREALAVAIETLELAPLPDLLARAVALGLEIDVSIYDSRYLALAEREGTAVVTWDQRLLRRATASPHAHLVAPLDPSWTP